MAEIPKDYANNVKSLTFQPREFTNDDGKAVAYTALVLEFETQDGDTYTWEKSCKKDSRFIIQNTKSQV